MCVPAEPAVNEVIDPIKAIESYKRENKYLKDELALHDTLINRTGVSYDALSEQQLYEVENQCRRFIDGSLDEIDIQNARQVQGQFSFHSERMVRSRFFSGFQRLQKSVPVSELLPVCALSTKNRSFF